MSYFVNTEEAIKLLQSGNVVALPTETVYGLAASAYNDQAVQKVYTIKNRPFNKSLIIHYDSIENVEQDFCLTQNIKKVTDKFWPGPLTLILKKKPLSKLSSLINQSFEEYAVRIPGHFKMREIISATGPLVAPSANAFSHISPTMASHVKISLGDQNYFILNGGDSKIGIESTIIKVEDNYIYILRTGAIDKSTIEKECNITCSYQENNHIPGSSNHSHYKPYKPIRINVKRPRQDEGLLCFGTPAKNKLPSQHFFLSRNGNYKEAAFNFFRGLYFLEQTDCTCIGVMHIPLIREGIAINERLRRIIVDREK